MSELSLRVESFENHQKMIEKRLSILKSASLHQLTITLAELRELEACLFEAESIKSSCEIVFSDTSRMLAANLVYAASSFQTHTLTKIIEILKTRGEQDEEIE